MPVVVLSAAALDFAAQLLALSVITNQKRMHSTILSADHEMDGEALSEHESALLGSPHGHSAAAGSPL